MIFTFTSGGTPHPNVTWLRNGTVITTPQSTKYMQRMDGALILTSTSLEDKGRYTVLLTNPFGETEYTPELTFLRRKCIKPYCTMLILQVLIIVYFMTVLLHPEHVWVECIRSAILYATIPSIQSCMMCN